jgi:hypothetical protein
MTENNNNKSLVLSPDTEALEKAAHLMVTGDISKMTMVEKAGFLTTLAKALNLSPFPRPFELIPGRNGKEIIYANKSCTDQLRKIYGVSVEITYAGPLMIGETANPNVFIVRAKATDKDGRTDESVGSVSLAGLGPEDLANATMKCETKAKRRVTLSVCGLNFLDETEVIGQSWNGNQKVSTLPGPRMINPGVATHTTGPVIGTIVESNEGGLPPIKIE